MDPGHAILCCLSLYDALMTVSMDIITSSAVFAELLGGSGVYIDRYALIDTGQSKVRERETG